MIKFILKLLNKTKYLYYIGRHAIADPFVGRTSLFKVITGTIYSGSSIYNVKRKEK